MSTGLFCLILPITHQVVMSPDISVTLTLMLRPSRDLTLSRTVLSNHAPTTDRERFTLPNIVAVHTFSNLG